MARRMGLPIHATPAGIMPDGYVANNACQGVPFFRFPFTAKPDLDIPRRIFLSCFTGEQPALVAVVPEMNPDAFGRFPMGCPYINVT